MQYIFTDMSHSEISLFSHSNLLSARWNSFNYTFVTAEIMFWPQMLEEER
jgi:hypothetical protein